MRRYAFIPSDYKEPVVLGWKTPHGFVPDQPVQSNDGILIRLRMNQDTPTEPPGPPEDG